MKIALVSHIYPTQQAPARATFIKNEAHLIKGNHEVEIYLPYVFSLPFQKQYYRSHNPDEDQIPVHRFSYISIPRRKLPAITKKSLSDNLLKAIQPQSPDLVHLHWVFPSGMAAPALKSKDLPVIITLHGGDWYTNLGNSSLFPLIKKSLEAADGLICVGKQLYDDISDKLPGLKSKLHHFPHGIDTTLFKPPKNKSHPKQQLGWNNKHIHLLCVANLYYEKGIDLLVRALPKLKSRPYHLHIISAHQDSKEKRGVLEIIQEHKLQDRITFHPQQSQKDLVLYLQAADLLISPSRKEGFGLVVAEAISCGTPVLATKSGGPEEIITAQTGLLVETDNPNEIQSGLKEMLSNLDQYQSSKLHADIDERFSLSAKLKKLMSLYRSVLEESQIR